MNRKTPSQTEIALLQRSREGDHAAFKDLYDLNVAPLFRFMSQFSPGEDRVKEWVQRAFIKAYENLPSFNGTSLFATWLFKLALNEMRTDFRRAAILSFVSSQGDEHASEQDEGASFQWDHTMKHWLKQLDETKRAVFLLYEVEGYSHAEIAEFLQIRESTSRTLLTRARQFLRKRWEEERKAI